MEKRFNDFIRRVCQDHAKDVVGRVLAQYDILKNDKTLTDKQRFEALKKFNREVIYQEYRSLRNMIIFYNEGREYQKYPIYDPAKKDEEQS